MAIWTIVVLRVLRLPVVTIVVSQLNLIAKKMGRYILRA